MSYGQGPVNSKASYLPPEFQLPEDPKQAKEFLAQRERQTASILNVKINGQFEKQELLSGEQWFSTQGGGANRQERYGYRTVFDLVSLNGGKAIPADGTFHAFAHNLPISNITAGLRIYGSGFISSGVTNPPQLVPIPYASATANSVIELYFDATNININVGTNNGSGLNPCYVVIEYLKQP